MRSDQIALCSSPSTAAAITRFSGRRPSTKTVARSPGLPDTEFSSSSREAGPHTTPKNVRSIRAAEIGVKENAAICNFAPEQSCTVAQGEPLRPGGTSRVFAQHVAAEPGVQPKTAWGWSGRLAAARRENRFLRRRESRSARPLPGQDVQEQRCLQEEATNQAPCFGGRCLESGQRTRAKPFCRSPHLRKSASDCSTMTRQ